MTMCYNTIPVKQQLPHIPFGHVLKKACMQQEQTMQTLEMLLQNERMNYENLRKEMYQLEEDNRNLKTVHEDSEKVSTMENMQNRMETEMSALGKKTKNWK